MTFCLGMRVKDGLVGIADTRVTSGSECITARKASIYHGPGWSFFLMTSGLPSVRDSNQTVMHRYDKAELSEISEWWQERLRRSVRELSLSWIEPLLAKLPGPSLLPLKLAGAEGA